MRCWESLYWEQGIDIESLSVDSPGADEECGEEPPREQGQHVNSLKAVSVVLLSRVKQYRDVGSESEGELNKTWIWEGSNAWSLGSS